MKRIIQSLLARADLRLVRSSLYARQNAEFAALEIELRSATERCEAKLRSAMERCDSLESELDVERERNAGSYPVGTRSSEANAVIDAVCARSGILKAEELRLAYAHYDSLKSVWARESVSRALLQRVADGTCRPDLTDPALDSFQSHELQRQLAATLDFTAGRVAEAAAKWEQLAREIPSPLNLVCDARCAIAKGEMQHAFSKFMLATDRYPFGPAIALELATFFLRIGNTGSANAALEALRQRFLEERSALAPVQARLDSALDAGQMENANPVAPAWRRELPDDVTGTEQDLRSGLWNERTLIETTLRNLIARIMSDSNVTDVVEYGVLDKDRLASLARTMPTAQFTGLVPAPGNVSGRCFPSNLRFADIAAVDEGADDALGPHVVVIQMEIAHQIYPARLAGLYATCQRLGVPRILIAEPLDFDRDSLRYHDAGAFPRVTRLGREGRFLHDFGRLLDDSGYRIVETVPVPPALFSGIAFNDDHRFLVAGRRDDR